MIEAVIVANVLLVRYPRLSPAIRVPKAVANTASRRISEKTGMRIVATEERD